MSKKLNSPIQYVVHSKPLVSPIISPIVRSGIPELSTVKSDKLDTLENFVTTYPKASFELSPDIFSEIFQDQGKSQQSSIHVFSTQDAGFVLHNVLY